jgi:hypothetical protein
MVRVKIEAALSSVLDCAAARGARLGKRTHASFSEFLMNKVPL